MNVIRNVSNEVGTESELSSANIGPRVVSHQCAQIMPAPPEAAPE